MDIKARTQDDSARIEREVKAMLHVVPPQVRKGDYLSALNWKDTVKEAAKALGMAAGARRDAALGRIHIALCAMGGVIREDAT